MRVGGHSRPAEGHPEVGQLSGSAPSTDRLEWGARSDANLQAVLESWRCVSPWSRKAYRAALYASNWLNSNRPVRGDEPFGDIAWQTIRKNGARVAVTLTLTLAAVHSHTSTAAENSIEVTATAYNSVESQTSKQPWIAAWGDSLAPGMRVIAVSRDLLKLGLGRGTVVRIEGLDGKFVVLDKMNKRWKRKIDVYMGSDIAAAREFGRRKVTLEWVHSRPEQSAALPAMIAEAETR